VEVPYEAIEPLITHKVDPAYPESARDAQLQGEVLLDILVAADGTVAEIHPRSGPEILTSAAGDAVRWWRFQPYRLNGTAVPVQTTVSIDFRVAP
jgi:protein TonB